ncbi:hypothetical protein F5Y19DRAFT_482739 [Xylariaceae sp. FL1651]|nr:hypothetical protein F5Y19DRAFT_482739 [Xylariaceae sp. FL1651]
MKPPLACCNCRVRKKKCDRAYPICSYCLKTHDRCSYRIHGSSLKPRRRALVATISDIPQRTALSTAAMFLDYSLFQVSLSHTLTSNVPIGPELRDYVISDNELSRRIDAFINVFDAWMPFIPRQELREKLSGRATQPHGEDILLFACIRNLTEPLEEENPATKQYLAIKSVFIGAEVAGVITIPLLQALLLVLLYEFGHGLYPSAYMTLGTCTRYLVILGINGAGPSPIGAKSWIEEEKQRRLWWAVFIMERAIALGCPQRSLSIPEPDNNKVLPSDELSWEHESPSPQSSLTLASPPMSNMGNFRLLVHACCLLGRVLQYISDDSSYEHSGALQIYNTICALIKVLEVEATCGMSVSVPRSILHSAIFTLCSAAGYIEPGHPVQQSPRHFSASDFLKRAREFLNGNLGTVGQTSPFLIHWGFQAFQYYYLAYQQDGRPENEQAVEDLEKSFHVLERRWKLAGIYTTLLNASQEELIMDKQ